MASTYSGRYCVFSTDYFIGMFHNSITPAIDTIHKRNRKNQTIPDNRRNNFTDGCTCGYIGLRYFQFSLFTVMVSYLCIEYIAQIARIWIVLPYIEFSYREYSKEILYPIGKVTIVLVAIHLFIKSFLSNTNWEIFCGLCLSELLCITICFSLGINSIERQQIIMFITNRIKQCKNRNIP